ncbi:ribonucleoside-diphosphate reductase subunit alpha [Hydrogenibacillus schlegelii]|uniref:Ribonucleoside-diphosphate reductase n=2 Tax=Hydrogenibacillus schlegelii TaxID=1484 RepID=A0A179ITZ5_HYDSH|nr:ribonucleoside-diphosphate reductase subunit alpha [Hydrogenibacillus schlegelii]OAR05250.1 ribonucleotide-diphosphate reductase subunit alpha [Hydrogenibacillus schlegelii]PTQ53525.1 MAG: Ribonucleotide reductase of class Ia (aerobic), alpha subunit [Hydrogenibacillus schlegelii]
MQKTATGVRLDPLAFVEAEMEAVLPLFSELEAERVERFRGRVRRYVEEALADPELRESLTESALVDLLVRNSLDEVSVASPRWTYVAARFYLRRLYREAAANRGYVLDPAHPYGDFVALLRHLHAEGVYSDHLLVAYTEDELRAAARMIVPERDHLFNLPGLLTLATRYLARDKQRRTFELPQERFLVIALYLMQKEERSKRLALVEEAYWALSNLYMTVATPTFANAGKAWGQLSSCFIDVVDDSLRGIYDSNTDVALLSKAGGGIGVYLGKLRPRGSMIKGIQGLSSGIVPWARQLNNTAISVDQLGQRQGAIAIYLDVWHKDILEFLDLKLNHGDERLRTHDLFTGVVIPDLFMEKVEAREDWYLFDPHEVRMKKGWSLEDFYDEEVGRGSFREKYQELVDDPNISKKIVPAIEIMKRIMRSQLETGVPYMMYRDTANRMNPNKHAGVIYASNLCTEILQNNSATTVVEEYLEEDGTIVTKKKPGDFVVCNLSSINLARAVPDGVLERLIPIQVRMLDNVIDLNKLEVLQAQVTNQKYRAIGLGTYGWHHLLALKRIRWESDEAVRYADELYEKIAYLTIKASNELAKEKGPYPLFPGSEWESGLYFERRGYTSPEWQALKEDVRRYGVRNGYMMAIAPNGTTAIVGGSTPSIDPIYRKEYVEEKNTYRIPIVAPDIEQGLMWYYKSAHEIDQHWTIRQQAARSRHIDQGASLNLYVKNTIKAKELLDLHLAAWRSGVKTTYYVRSTSVEVEECEVCQS